MFDWPRKWGSLFVVLICLAGCTTGGGGGGGGGDGGDGGGAGGGDDGCTSNAACDDGEQCTTDICQDGVCSNAPIEGCVDPGDGGDGGDGDFEGTTIVTFTLADAVYRIEAVEGATAENVSDALDAIAPGTEDSVLNTSPNGQWLILDTDRFDAECVGWRCLAVVAGDLSSGAVVRAGGQVIHPSVGGTDGFSAVSNTGDLVVFPGDSGPHSVDLFATTHISGDDWTAPVLLTDDSPHNFNSQPAISADGSRVVFDCGPIEFGQEGTNICEVQTNGSNFRTVRAIEDAPPGLPTGVALHHPDYAPDGSIILEGDWGGETIWQLSPGADDLVRVGDTNNDNSPCVLPDGRIASLAFLTSDNHDIKIMNADGTGLFVLFDGADVLDIGLGCGGMADDDGGDGASGTTQLFPAEAIWYQDISDAPLDGQSAEVISWLDDAGGWGTGELRIDFSIEVLTADGDAPFRSFEPTEDHFLPDCDADDVPVPSGGALEGEQGYECENDGDCHLIVVHEPTNTLYEMWRANMVDGDFFGGCLAVWDLGRTYDGSGRGENCTSADAAGYPIAPLLFSADEVAAGSIDHAIRFILPNDRIRNGVYVHPATHSTGATSGPDTAPPYGAHLRLRADYPVESLPTAGARTVARALQQYGMFLSDGGNIALTAQSDRFTDAKWEGLLDTRDLNDLQVSDFEMVDGGQRFTYTGDCAR